MFDHKHFVPILKFKQGERAALKELPQAISDKFTPLIELDALPENFDPEKDQKSIDEFLHPIPDEISKCFGKKPFFLDPWLIEDFEKLADGSHPLDWLYQQMASLGVNAIPVIGFGRAQSFIDATIKIAAKTHNVCLRIEASQLAPSPAKAIQAILGKAGVSYNSADLIIDFEYLEESNIPMALLAMGILKDIIPSLDQWRSFTVAASGFPVNLSGYSGTDRIPRTEWAFYKDIVSNHRTGGRIPTYGDYGVNHPFLPEAIDPRLLSPSANIRYTAEDDWLILKGKSVRKTPGFAQFNLLSKQLVGMPEFLGHDFSPGDAFIERCSNGGKPGSLSTWRQVGASHHITFVVEQLSKYYDS